jgi:hypothetical protein
MAAGQSGRGWGALNVTVDRLLKVPMSRDADILICLVNSSAYLFVPNP